MYLPPFYSGILNDFSQSSRIFIKNYFDYESLPNDYYLRNDLFLNNAIVSRQKSALFQRQFL